MKTIFPTLGTLFLLAACGLPYGGGPGPDTPVMRLEYSMDGVKLITPDIRRGDDAIAWLQPTYDLAPTRRLLVRFESLADHAGTISLDGGRTVKLTARLVTPDPDGSQRAAIRACPVTTAWMMLATWDRPDPFIRWNAPGGDFDNASCAAVEAADPADPQALSFDVREWFRSHARGRNTNHGLLLVVDRPIRIYGDTSGPHSPRVTFDKFLPGYYAPERGGRSR